MCKILILIACVFNVQPIFAGKPVWTFTPLTPTTIRTTRLTVTQVDYLITNQSKKTHTLSVQPTFFGEIITLPGYCGAEFTLAYLQSCVLRLEIVGGRVAANFTGGPVACQIGGTFQCYQPEQNDTLTIIHDSRVVIKVDLPNITFVGPETTKTINVTNLLNDETAYNIQVDLSNSNLAQEFSQDISDCEELPPGQTCQIELTRNSITTVPLTTTKVQGANTIPAKITIQASV